MPSLISNALIVSLFQARYRDRERIANLILQKVVRAKAAGTYDDPEKQLTWMLAESYRPLLKTVAHRLGANGSLDDVVSKGITVLQEEFAETDLRDSEGAPLIHPQRYFLNKAYWRMRDYLNAEKRIGDYEVSLDERNMPDTAMPSADPMSAELVSIIWDAIDTLPQKYQEVMSTVYDRDDPGSRISGEEAAERLGIPLNTLDSRLHRARNALYTVLREHPSFAEQLR